MAAVWAQLAPAVATRITSQLSGGSPPPVFRSMVPINQSLPYIVITPVIDTELQVFDDSAETTEVEFDLSVYSTKTGASADVNHLNWVEMASQAVRRWEPTMTNWDAHPIRQDSRTQMTILEDAIQTVVSFSVVTQRK